MIDEFPTLALDTRAHVSPRSILDAVARRSALALLSRLERGSLTIVEGDDRASFGRPRDPLAATVTVHDPSAYRALAFGGSVAAGESYMQGLWTCDDLPTLVRILARNLDTVDAIDGGPARLARRAAALLSHVGRRNTRAGSRKNIAHHYDLSNELFGLFLDESKMYSSAIFEPANASLEAAQQTKLARICDKLALGPNDHLVEIGTGWGALAIFVARTCGCRVTTTTVSREQHHLATARVREAGLEDKIEVLLSDYRDLTGTYDKLVSIEMIEAVGHEYLDDYFRACSERLKPDGVMLVQAITIADQRYERQLSSVDFIQAHIFPGSCIPSITTIVGAATRASDLRLADLEDLTTHYARTVKIWRERFLARRAEVRALGFDESFVRMWEYYLAYCEGGFDEGYLGCAHLVFTKPQARRGATRETHARRS